MPSTLSSYQAANYECQCVLAYCLLRQGNILRQMGQTAEALELGEREVSAARASGDELTLARSLISNATTLIVGSEIDNGLSMVDEAHSLLQAGESDDSKQGLGWFWILQADIANARLIYKGSLEIIHFVFQAIEVLPLENWTEPRVRMPSQRKPTSSWEMSLLRQRASKHSSSPRTWQ